MAQTVASLIVELRSNSAAFAAEMDKARVATEKVGHGHAFTAQQMSRFAAIATQTVIPQLDGMRVALEGAYRTIASVSGGFGALIGAVAPLGAALVGLFAGNFLRNFSEAGSITTSFGERLQVAAGITGSYKERLAKA